MAQNAASQPVGFTRKKEPSIWYRIWQHRMIYLFILPAFIWFCVFCYYPMYGILLSFKDFQFNLGILGSKWVGLRWFSRFLSDPQFWQILYNTLRISVLKMIFGFPAPIILALMLNAVDNVRFKKLIQTISYLPHFVSWVIVAAIIQKLLSPYGGLVNEIRKLFDPNVESIFYLGQTSLFYPILVVSDIWKGVGWGTIIYLAALAGIDPNLYEAAAIDGARRFQMTWHITLPCLYPTIGVLLILNLGGILNAGFEQILLLQTSPTLKVGEVIDTYVLRRGLMQGNHSYSTAIGLTKSLITMSLIILVNNISRKLSEVSLW